MIDRLLAPCGRGAPPSPADGWRPPVPLSGPARRATAEKTRELHRRVDHVMECAEQLGNSAEILRAASELRRIVELEAKLTGGTDQPRQREIVVRIRKDVGTSDDDPSAYEELRYRQPQHVAALPAGDDAVDAEVEDAGEVMQ